jgi:hypothetical protein
MSEKSENENEQATVSGLDDPICSGLCSRDETETLPDIAQAFMDRDWCRFALLVSGAPEIEKPGKAHWAMREIAIAAIERLKYEEQQNHLEAVTDYAINAERDCR